MRSRHPFNMRSTSDAIRPHATLTSHCRPPRHDMNAAAAPKSPSQKTVNRYPSPPMIPLPSLRTTTNTTLTTHTTTLTPTITSRKRKESPNVCCGNEPKRLKITDKLTKYGGLRPIITPKVSLRAPQSAKMHLAVQNLAEFADTHQGKLPSLRYIMKMLKVGFPKAHEILDEYGARIGRTKEEIMAAMTVRQENEKKANCNKNKNKKQKQKVKENKAIKKEEMNKRVPLPLPPSLPHRFSATLAHLLEKVSGEVQWDVLEKEYLWNINKLESFINAVTASMLLVCSLEDKIEIATAYYIVAEAFYHRWYNIDTAIRYIARSLYMFKDLNKQWSRTHGINNKENTNGKRMPWHHPFVDCTEYHGFFWSEIVTVLILRADILRYGDDYRGAQINYELGLNLVQSANVQIYQDESLKETQLDLLFNTLESLTVIHAYQEQWNMAIKYGKQYLNQMKKMNHHKQGTLETVKMNNIIEVKAWLSASLMYGAHQKDKDEGYRGYREILAECQHRFGVMDSVTNRWVNYFAVHFIRNNEWNEAHQLMERILKIDEQYLNEALKEDMAETFKDYVEFLNKHLETITFTERCSFLRMFKERINVVMNVLHEKHIAIIRELNYKSKMKHDEYKRMNGKDGKDGDEDIDLLLYNKYNYNVDKPLYGLYPRVNVISVLTSHISLFLNIGNKGVGYKLLHDLVIPRLKCLNNASKYLEFYPKNKITQNEINALLNLL